MKTISIYHSGQLIKKFTCKLIDITKNGLLFIGAPSKVQVHDIDVAYYGKKGIQFQF